MIIPTSRMIIYNAVHIVNADNRFEVKVRSTPVKIYKTGDDYQKDMQVDETRPKRKSAIKYGSILDPGPYQKPLSITLLVDFISPKQLYCPKVLCSSLFQQQILSNAQ